MAIRLSLNLAGATCGELLRFADMLRSARVPAEQPVERSGPDHIEVSVTDPRPDQRSYGSESYGPESYGRPPESYGPTPADRPPGRPGPAGPPGHPGATWPPGVPGPPREWVPGYPAHYVAHYGMVGHARALQGAHLAVRKADREFVTDVSTETVEKWKAALTEALESTGLSETARGPLLELRAILSLEEFPRRGQ
jgi:hypothetical protein